MVVSLFKFAPAMVYMVVPPDCAVDLPVVLQNTVNLGVTPAPKARMSLTFNVKRAIMISLSALAPALVSKPASSGLFCAQPAPGNFPSLFTAFTRAVTLGPVGLAKYGSARTLAVFVRP